MLGRCLAHILHLPMYLKNPVIVWATNKTFLLPQTYKWFIDDLWSHGTHVGLLVPVNVVLL